MRLRRSTGADRLPAPERPGGAPRRRRVRRHAVGPRAQERVQRQQTACGRWSPERPADPPADHHAPQQLQVVELVEPAAVRRGQLRQPSVHGQHYSGVAYLSEPLANVPSDRGELLLVVGGHGGGGGGGRGGAARAFYEWCAGNRNQRTTARLCRCWCVARGNRRYRRSIHGARHVRVIIIVCSARVRMPNAFAHAPCRLYRCFDVFENRTLFISTWITSTDQNRIPQRRGSIPFLTPGTNRYFLKIRTHSIALYSIVMLSYWCLYSVTSDLFS